jgi:hypothetical protein
VLTTVLATIGGLVVLIIVFAVAEAATKSAIGKPSASSPPPPSAAAKHSTAGSTVTYVVSGSPAQVTYGPAGSSLNGHVPMDLTQPLANPIYYSITAQLNGGGRVGCKLLVDGKVISEATATGSYNIASCEITQGFSGGWQDANG